MNSLFTDLKTEIMIDKKQIITEFDRIIGNNQEVTDETHMDLVDECADYAETLVNKLFIQRVSQQRELLNGFREWTTECANGDDVVKKQVIDDYLETI